jgi:hypothetical protein
LEKGKKVAKQTKHERFRNRPIQCKSSQPATSMLQCLYPEKNKFCQLHSEKTLPKGVMRRTVGELAAYSAQPPAIQIHVTADRGELNYIENQSSFRVNPAS